MACALLHNAWTMPPSPEPTPSFRELLRRRALGRMMLLRLRGSPVVATIALLFIALEPTPLRIGLFGGAALSLLVVAWYESRQLAPSDARLTVNIFITGLLQLLVTFAAGGVAGPLLPGTVLVALVASVLLKPIEAGSFVLGVQIPVVWLFAFVQRSALLPGLWVPSYEGLFVSPGTEGSGPFVSASFTSLILVGAFVIGRVLRQVIGDLAAEMAEERQAALAQNIEGARTVSALSGEIAHELKNPLASIKGLTALVRRDLSGVPAERMDVLRREVDRMQSILDEFLTFSRPLVPLSIERTDLRDLVSDVIALHEGMAGERRQRLELTPGAPIWIRCDPRKVRQVVINLVQNAIEASPSDASISLELREIGANAELTVRDAGKGIPDEVLPRLFTVGMTTKERGTGLGLVVARGLARQHGGELALENDPRGGAQARLRLPTTVPEAATELAIEGAA